MFDFLELFLNYVANATVLVSEVGQRAEPRHPGRRPITGVFPSAALPDMFFKCFDEELPKLTSRATASILACPHKASGRSIVVFIDPRSHKLSLSSSQWPAQCCGLAERQGTT